MSGGEKDAKGSNCKIFCHCEPAKVRQSNLMRFFAMLGIENKRE
ncbi:MAG: hypothetical protein QXJ06_06060 [Candidatus Aenigmatarchaeota archaeon]